MSYERLRARGERELANKILADHDVKRGIEKFEKLAGDIGARRHLLARAMRLTPDMAPEVHAALDHCRRVLELDSPLEVYVHPAPLFNAAAVRPEGGRMFVVLSSSLLEAFDANELQFVVGHELGHHRFDHHGIPAGFLLSGAVPLPAPRVLDLFAWQRYAEVSCDRAGLVCAGGLEPSAHALFKLASGLSGGRIRVSMDQFLSQVGDLRREAGRLAKADEPARSDWFSTHPFSPLRISAVELFANSELADPPGAMAVDELEARVQELMSVMQPSYLQERSDAAEAMRRLLFAAGVAIAGASGELAEAELRALEELLGPGSVPREPKADVIRADLPRRIDAVRALVPGLRRAQVVRDLCVIARADGQLDSREQAIIRDVARAIEVDLDLVACYSDDSEQAHT